MESFCSEAVKLPSKQILLWAEINMLSYKLPMLLPMVNQKSKTPELVWLSGIQKNFGLDMVSQISTQ